MTSFKMMCGIPGSGKTYIADKRFGAEAVIIDSDRTREKLLGDATRQDANSLVFSHMLKETCECLRRDIDTVYVATNISMKRRINLLKSLKKKFPNVRYECYLVIAPYDVCVERNAARERRVPEWVITKMMRQFDPVCENEGWDYIEVINNFYNDGTLTLDGDEYTYRISYNNKVLEFGSQSNSHHKLTLADHCEKCGKLAYEALVHKDRPFTRDESDLCFAAIIHDYGKVFTATRWEKDNFAEVHYPNHAEVGSYLALTMGYNLHTALLVRFHMLHYCDEATQKAWRVRIGEKLWSELALLNKFDRLAHD